MDETAMQSSARYAGPNWFKCCNSVSSEPNPQRHSVHHSTTTTTTVLRPFFWDNPGELLPEENLLDFYGARKDNRDRHIHHPAGRYSIRTNKSVTHFHHPLFFTPDALPAVTLPLYPGLGHTTNMLVCIPSGVVSVHHSK